MDPIRFKRIRFCDGIDVRLDDDVDWCETDEVDAIDNSHLPSGNILAVIIDAFAFAS